MKRISFLFIAFFVGAGSFLSAWERGGWGGMPHYFGYPGGLGILFMIFRLFIFATLVAIVVIALIRMYRNKNSRHKCCGKMHVDRGMEILRERYAKGEIGDEEYERMKKVLLDNDC